MQRAGKAVEGDTKRLVSRLADAEFVSLRCRADGDALAATGILARALGAIDTPFQATVRRLGSDREPTTDADLVVRVGLTDPTTNTGRAGSTDADDSDEADGTDDSISLPGEPTPASLTAIGLARELGTDPDPVLALAGGVAASVRDARDPFGGDSADSDDGVEAAHSTGPIPTFDALSDRARDDGRLGDRVPGISLPTADAVDGLAHTTLAYTTFSGDGEATRERCGPLAAAENGREIASLLACSVVGTENASPRAARAVERALRPVSLPDSSPFATLEGYADVLSTVAAERPGIGIALACGYDVREPALSAWRAHARRAHTALRTATVSRYDGLCVARLADGPAIDASEPEQGDGHDDTSRTAITTIARLLRDFRSPEPIALVVDDGLGAIAATDDRGLGSVVTRAARAGGGVGSGSERLGEARFSGSAEEFVAAVRSELAGSTRDARDGDDGLTAPRGEGGRS